MKKERKVKKMKKLVAADAWCAQKKVSNNPSDSQMCVQQVFPYMASAQPVQS